MFDIKPLIFQDFQDKKGRNVGLAHRRGSSSGAGLCGCYEACCAAHQGPSGLMAKALLNGLIQTLTQSMVARVHPGSQAGLLLPEM